MGLSKLIIILISCVSTLLVGGCTFETTSSTETSSPELEVEANETGTVLWVVDGDTVQLEINGNKESVRLIGIDTPESRANTQPVQCFGQEASDFLTELLPEGTEVTFARDVEVRDRYDRLLLYIFVDDIFVNEELVRQGYANARSYRPNTARQDVLNSALAEAKRENRGLWAACDGPEQPL